MDENLITLKIKYSCKSDEDSLIVQSYVNYHSLK